MDLIKATEKLSDLYSATGCDWQIEIHCIVTEPVCPTVTITPEGWPIQRYCFFSEGDIAKTVADCVDKVYAEIVERKPGKYPDDKGQFMDWLRARWAGSDEKMPVRKRNGDGVERSEASVEGASGG